MKQDDDIYTVEFPTLVAADGPGDADQDSQPAGGPGESNSKPKRRKAKEPKVVLSKGERRALKAKTSGQRDLFDTQMSDLNDGGAASEAMYAAAAKACAEVFNQDAGCEPSQVDDAVAYARFLSGCGMGEREALEAASDGVPAARLGEAQAKLSMVQMMAAASGGIDASEEFEAVDVEVSAEAGDEFSVDGDAADTDESADTAAGEFDPEAEPDDVTELGLDELEFAGAGEPDADADSPGRSRSRDGIASGDTEGRDGGAPDDFDEKYGRAEGRPASGLRSMLAQIRSKRHEPPTKEQEIELAMRIQAGDVAAEHELVLRNMRFLVNRAGRMRKTGRNMEDIIQMGAIGLITAAKRLDPQKGRFTTLAEWYVQLHMQRGIEADALVHTPSYVPYAEAKLRRQAEAAESQEEREALLTKAEAAGRRAAAGSMIPESLNRPLGGPGEDGGETFMDRLEEDSEKAGPEEREEVRRILARLVHFAHRLDRESTTRRDVFLMRLGLHPDHAGEAMRLPEIAEIFGVSRERVRQMYASAASEIGEAMVYWAKGVENLPDGFLEGLQSPDASRRGGSRKQSSDDADGDEVAEHADESAAAPKASKRKARP